MHVSDLEFADDVLGHFTPTLQPALHQLPKSFGLEVDPAGAKATTVSSGPTVQQFFINGQPVECNPSFKYLSSFLLPNGQTRGEFVLWFETPKGPSYS